MTLTHNTSREDKAKQLQILREIIYSLAEEVEVLKQEHIARQAHYNQQCDEEPEEQDDQAYDWCSSKYDIEYDTAQTYQEAFWDPYVSYEIFDQHCEGENTSCQETNFYESSSIYPYDSQHKLDHYPPDPSLYISVVEYFERLDSSDMNQDSPDPSLYISTAEYFQRLGSSDVDSDPRSICIIKSYEYVNQEYYCQTKMDTPESTNTSAGYVQQAHPEASHLSDSSANPMASSFVYIDDSSTNGLDNQQDSLSIPLGCRAVVCADEFSLVSLFDECHSSDDGENLSEKYAEKEIER